MQARARQNAIAARFESAVGLIGRNGTGNPGNGAGLHISGGIGTTVLVSGGLIQNNEAFNSGGGIWNSGAAELTVENGTQIINNFALGASSTSGGGGIYSDGGTLTSAEAAGPPPALAPAALLPAYYLNELLLKLLAREDRHEAVYEAYGIALAELAGGAEAAALRRFERSLLDELGYGIDLTREAASGKPLEAAGYYHFQAGRGVLAVRDGDQGPDCLTGRALLSVARGDYVRPAAQRAARGVYGAAIAYCLEGRGLASREVMLAMRRREKAAGNER